MKIEGFEKLTHYDWRVFVGCAIHVEGALIDWKI